MFINFRRKRMLGLARGPFTLFCVLIIFIFINCHCYIGISDCICPQKIYEITTRRNFCGEELAKYFNASGRCFKKREYECPKDGPGPANETQNLRNVEDCAINCQGTQNPKICIVTIVVLNKKVAENSFKSLYPNGKLPKSHVPKVAG
jgi:hypothetical protein